MYKYVLATALIVGFALPAFAEKGFYIVRGSDNKCTVVETAPSAGHHRHESRKERLRHA